MTLTSVAHEPVVLVQVEEGSRDAYNVRAHVEETTQAAAGFIQETDEREQLVGQETYVSVWTLVLPADQAALVTATFGRELSAKDRVQARSKTFELTAALPIYHPRHLTLHHVRCRMVEVTG